MISKETLEKLLYKKDAPSWWLYSFQNSVDIAIKLIVSYANILSSHDDRVKAERLAAVRLYLAAQELDPNIDSSD